MYPCWRTETRKWSYKPHWSGRTDRAVMEPLNLVISIVRVIVLGNRPSPKSHPPPVQL